MKEIKFSSMKPLNKKQAANNVIYSKKGLQTNVKEINQAKVSHAMCITKTDSKTNVLKNSRC